MQLVPFEWSDNCEGAFLQLKRNVVEPTTIVYPAFTKRFVDSSQLAVGACQCTMWMVVTVWAPALVTAGCLGEKLDVQAGRDFLYRVLGYRMGY